MYFRCFLLIILVASWSRLALSSEREVFLLEEAVNSLFRGLQFMEDNIVDVNLDGAFGCRLSAEHIDAFLQHSPHVFYVLGDHLRFQLEVLSRKAKDIADNAKSYVQQDTPEYYRGLGKLLDESEVLVWYPSRSTQQNLREKPLSCSKTAFNETLSDICLKNLLGTRDNKTKPCYTSKECLTYMTKPGQRGYTITHQALYFQTMEKSNCLGRSPLMKIPESLQVRLCTNILRDAEEIVKSNYPLRHRDLFMEQIGLCGIWGFKDFYRADWLENILQWQKPSGCYGVSGHWKCDENLVKNSKLRVKRAEKEMADGCLSHKTTVALLAITASIRFSAEKIAGAA